MRTASLLEHSETYDSIGIDSPAEVARILRLPKPEVHFRTDKNGVPLHDQSRRGAGRTADSHIFSPSAARSKHNERPYTISPAPIFFCCRAMIVVAGLLGWALAGRAIQPLNSVAQAAQNITGSNLSLRIPRARRG